jgi:hypothetical protein
MTIQPWVDSAQTSDPPSPAGWIPRAQTDPESTAVASWDAPSWADCSAADEECVVHRLSIGEVCPTDGDAPFRVEVVQRDEMSLATGSTSVTRTQARISVSGEILTPQEAQDLARLLSTASEVIQ